MDILPSSTPSARRPRGGRHGNRDDGRLQTVTVDGNDECCDKMAVFTSSSVRGGTGPVVYTESYNITYRMARHAVSHNRDGVR